jgi:hypothetical protein
MAEQTMVERVAKALWAYKYPDPEFGPALSGRCRKDFTLLARAAIEAMRTPTEAMEEAGAWDEWNGNTEMAAGITWEAMIDAALKP